MNDKERLIKLMKDFGSGRFDKANPEEFEDKELAEAFNSMRDEVVDRNNYYLLKLNESVKVAAESEWLREMIEAIDAQTSYLKDFQAFYDAAFASAEGTDVKNADILSGVRMVKNNIRPCIDGTEEILDALKLVKDGNAFSAGEIDKIVRLLEFNRRTLETMEYQTEDTVQMIVSIYEELVKQNQETRPMIDNGKAVLETCNSLSMQCFDAGKRMNEIARNENAVRDSMFKKNTQLNLHDCLRVYAVDHRVLLAKLYNHISEYDVVDFKELSDPSKCKFGVWLNETSPEWFRETTQYRKLFDIHEQFHRHVVNAYRLNADSGREAALKEYEEAKKSLSEILPVFAEVHDLLKEHGIEDDDLKTRVEKKLSGDKK